MDDLNAIEPPEEAAEGHETLTGALEGYLSDIETLAGAVESDDPKAAHEYATRLKVNYPTLVGVWDGQRVAEDYGNRIGALPFTVIMDRHGRIAYTKPGQIARDEAEAIVIPLLGAAGPT